MTIGILGRKIGMTQIFDEKGNAVAVTIVKSGPCCITQIKSTAQCGYDAVQLGYEEITTKNRHLTKPNLGHFVKNNLIPHRYLREYKVSNISEYTIGQEICIELFKIGQKIAVSGQTIGKGFASNIKRNHFARGPMTHGSKHHRLQGSLGAGTSPGRVFPGKKMAGRLGMDRQTIKNLEILDIDYSENLLVIRGSLPGKIGNLLSLKCL